MLPANEGKLTPYPLFQEKLQAHFPGAWPLDFYVQQTQQHLFPLGFVDDNTMAAVAVCRDEIAEPLLDTVIKYWGKTFDFRSLGGFLLAGKSGVATMLAHTPISQATRRFVLFAMPHIAISKDGEIGFVDREGIEQASHACGSLAAVLHELHLGQINLQTDLDDIEQCMVRQKVLSAIHYGDKPDQVAITKLACRIISEDVKRLLSSIDSSQFHYAVLTGILIHGPNEIDWVYPQHSYVVDASLPSGVCDIQAFCG